MEKFQQKAVSYCRVSSKEQAEEGYSLEAQESYLNSYAQKNNFEVVKTFKISESASGKQVRKTFREMIEYTNKHKIKVILCEKTDRLTRNPKDAVEINDWIEADPERQIHLAKESSTLHKESKAHEKFVWDIKVATASYYTNNLSEEVKKGYAEKLKQGWMPYRAPLGYKTIGEQGHKTHIVDPATALYVKEIFNVYCTGLYSLHKLASLMFQQGLRTNTGRKMGANGVHVVLKNPFYYGDISWNGKIYPGKHEPIITRDLFETAQRVMKNGRPDKYKKHNPLFKGLVTCGACGHKVSWYQKKGHWYGRCAHFRKCPQVTLPIREDRLVDQVFPFFQELNLRDEDIETLKKKLQTDHILEIQSRQSREADISRNLTRNSTKLDVAYQDRLEGRISSEQYDSIRTRVEADSRVLAQTLEMLQNDTIDYFDLGINLMKLANKIKELFPFAKKEEQQEIFTLAFDRMAVTDKTLSINFTPWFAKLHSHLPELKQICEPAFALANTKKKDQTTSDHLSWLGRLDSNQRPSD